MNKAADGNPARQAGTSPRLPLGYVRPSAEDREQTPGGQPPEDVEDRPNVGTVTPGIIPKISEQRVDAMAIAITPLVERIARVLAGQRLSANADGFASSAALDVDIEWQDDVDDAIAVLKAMREPDQLMAAAGDEQVWHRMISVAIEEATGPIAPSGPN